MRQLTVLTILLLAMFALKTLAIEGQSLLLASIGFVLLASFSAGSIVNAIKLPRVTGYVLAGVLLGPKVFDILSSQVVTDITMFNTLALGLIALGAGLELEIDAIKAVGKTLFATVVSKVMILFPLVVGVIYLVETQFGWIGVSSTGALITVGLVMGTLAIGTSPAVALAVIEETGRHGRVSKLVLGSAVVKDIVMVLFLALSIAVGNVLITDNSSFSYTVVTDLLGEIALSVLVGALVGGALVLYTRYVKRSMLVVVSLVILAVGELSVDLHLEMLLVFICAGFIVANFSELGHELMKTIRTVSLPVFVVFFTNAGALIDLPKVQELLPFALIIFGVRLIGLFVSHKIGSNIGGESREVKTWGWLGYMPQAGVTLGLMAIAAERLPEVAPYFTSLGLGLVATNLLIGPMSLRLALVKGEGFDSDRSFDDPVEAKDKLEVQDVFSGVKSDKVRGAVQEVYDSFTQFLISEGQKKSLAGQQVFLDYIESLPVKDITPNMTQRHALDKIAEVLDHESEDFISTIQRVQPVLDGSRQVVKVSLEKEDWTAVKDDPLSVRWRKLFFRLKSLVSSKELFREIPLQTLCKIEFNIQTARQGRYLLSLWYNSAVASYNEVRKLLDGSQDRSQTEIEVKAIWQHFKTAYEADLNLGLGQALSGIVRRVNRVGTAYEDSDSYRFSEVEPRIRKYLGETSERRNLWIKKQPAIVDSVLVYSMLYHLKRVIGRTLSEKCIAPLEILRSDVQAEGGELVKLLMNATASEQFDETSIFKSCESLNAKIRDQYLVLSSMRMLNREIAGNLGRMFDSGRKYDVIGLSQLGKSIEDPQQLRSVKVQFASNLNRTIFSIIFPPVEKLIDRVSEILDTFQDELDEVRKTLRYAMEGQTQKSSSGLVLSEGEISNLLSNVMYRIEENLVSVDSALDQIREKVDADVEEAFSEAQDLLQSQNVIRTATSSWLGFLQTGRAWGEERVGHFFEVFQKWFRRIRFFAKSFEDTPAAEELSRRLKSGDLDAIVIRDYLSDRISAPIKLERLPQIYRRLFTLDPLRDSRLFSAHRKVLDALPLGDDPEQTHRVLVVGKSGMGKSSLLNVAEMMAVDTRVVRLDRNYGTTHLSLLSLLARQIGSAANVRDICSAISKKPTTVIMDNMDHWWSPQSHDDVSKLMDIIGRSGLNVNWIASMDSFNYRLFTQAYSIRSLFHRVEFLQPLGHSALEKLILHRNDLSGLDVEYSRGMGLKIFDKVWRSGPQDIYFEVIKGASGGNIRSALQHWIQSIDWIDNRQVRVHIPKVASPDMTFLAKFNYESLLILKELYRFGPRSVRQLIDETHIRDNVLGREVESLRQSGLVVNKSRDGHIVQVDPMMKFYVGEQLAAQQVI